jgi:hypothetical protein
MSRTRITPALPATVVELAGGIAEDLPDYAREKIAHVLAHTCRPVLYSRLRVVRHRDPAREHPVTAQVNVDLDGRPLRVQVAASTPREAVDKLVDRLALRVSRAALDWEARRGRTFAGVTGEWRHGYPQAARLNRPRSPEERRVVRHTSLSPRCYGVDEAVAEMEDLGFDFHVFVEASREVDSVVYRSGPTGLRLAQVDGRADLVAACSAPVTRSTQPAPPLSVSQATQRLVLMGLPFVFFLDAHHCRGCVLYPRQDGNYGLVDPRGTAGWS